MTGLIIEGMASRVSSPFLIGRSIEVDRLRAALQLARERRSSATLVAGEAGVGKTRLVTEFADLARDDGAVVLLGGCIVLGDGALPYAPVVEALRGLVRRVPADELDALLGQGRSELARLLPDLGPAADEQVSGLSVGSAQGRLFELLLGVLERLAARAPVVFIVEDLQWSDRSTRDLLGFLVRNLRDAAVMLVLTYRSDELHRRHPLLPFLAEIDRAGSVDRLELTPFDRTDMAEQLRAIAGHDVDTALIESIHARSGGNAFFAEELLVAAGEDGRSELPSTLRDVLLARVADLAEADPGVPAGRLGGRAAGRPGAPGRRRGPGRGGPLRGAPRVRSVARCSSRIRRRASSATRSGTRCSRRRSTTTCCPVSGPVSTRRSPRPSKPASAGDASHAAELAYHWYAAHDLPRALESAVVAGTRPRPASRSRRRSPSTSARSISGTMCPTRRRERDATGSISSPPSRALPASTSRRAPWRTSRRRSASSTRRPTRCAAACCTSDSAGTRGSPARESSRSRPIAPPCA